MHPRNKKSRQIFLATTLVIGLAITSQAVRQASSQAAITLETQGQIAPISVEVNGQGVNNGYPDLIEDSQGNLWCAWVSARTRDPLLPHDHSNYEESDTILVRNKTTPYQS